MMKKLVLAFLVSEDGFLSAIGGLIAGKIFGGSAIAKAIGGAVGSFLGNRIGASEDRRNARLDYEQQRSLGFTHSEIAGAGGAGAGDTSQAIMGNQATQFEAQRRQQEYEMQERDKDRMVAMRGQDAQVQSSQISAGASMYGADVQSRIAQGKLALEQRRFDNIQLPQALNDLATTTPEWKRQELLARMGVDNVVATTIAGSMGIDIMNPDSLNDLSEKQFIDLIRTVYGLQSYVFRESSGAILQGNTIGSELQQSLGSGAPEANLNFGPQSILGSTGSDRRY
jgi:hypothetical protein